MADDSLPGSDPAPRRPLIAVVADRRRTSYDGWPDEPTDALFSVYVDLVEAAGGSCLLVPSTPASRDAAVRLVACVMIAGGRDIHPATYGRPAHPALEDPLLVRDEVEVAITLAALERGTPVLGVCRGMQLLNVALGGTLEQHLGDRLDVRRHRDGQFVDHLVRVAPGSRLAAVIGPGPLGVPSHHHQTVDALGDGLVPVAWAEDGVVEAIERPGPSLVLGVQWHPERGHDAGGLSLARALVAASSGRVPGQSGVGPTEAALA